MRAVHLASLRIAATYAALAVVWIIVSDDVVKTQENGGQLVLWSGWDSLKGLLFVAVTAAGLYLLVYGYGRQQQASRERQERILEEALAGWAAALDLRDHSTAEHTRRVTGLTDELARAMGVRDPEVTAMRRGATLHDIGKMGVPDSVLGKPGPLTPEEWVEMRRHPQLAAEFLSGVAGLGADVIDIPWCHHERYDGTGYPRGLAGHDIPLGARIFAIIDVYDALTSDRPYRPALTHAAAMEHVLAGSGSHFDPAVVIAFDHLMRGTAPSSADVTVPPVLA